MHTNIYIYIHIVYMYNYIYIHFFYMDSIDFHGLHSI